VGYRTFYIENMSQTSENLFAWHWRKVY
jgi:hypothetical protein